MQAMLSCPAISPVHFLSSEHIPRGIEHSQNDPEHPSHILFIAFLELDRASVNRQNQTIPSPCHSRPLLISHPANSQKTLPSQCCSRGQSPMSPHSLVFTQWSSAWSLSAT